MNTPSSRSGRAAKAAAATQNPTHNPAENRPSPRQIAGRTDQPGASNGSSSARPKSGAKRGESTKHPAAIHAPTASRAKLKGAAKTQARAQAKAEAKVKHKVPVKALTALAEKMAAKMVTEVLAQKMAEAEARAKAKAAAQAQAQPQAPQQPHYDNGQRYDTPGLHYAVGDPVPPPPAGAKVRLDLASRSDSDLAGFGQAHKGAMAGNANFPTPTPPATVFDGWLADFEAKLVELDNMKLIVKNLTEQKDAIRAGLQAVFQQRALYVEMASNGDPDIIATSGLPLRRPRTPVGELPWPTALVVAQSQTPGALIISWATVTHAKGYVLECAEVIADQPRVWKLVHSGGKLSTTVRNLEPGKTYEFRVAAMGGSTGQSDWSPAVSRMAA